MLKKLLLLSAAVVAAAASTASAQPIYFAWDECGTSALAVQNRDFACTANTGDQIAYSSFIAPAGLTQFVGTTTVLKIVTAGASTVDWWRMGSGECRAGGLTIDLPAAGADCADPYAGGNALSASIYQTNYFEPNGSRMEGDIGRDPPAALTEGTHYYAQAHILKNLKSTGGTACAGCSTPACIGLAHVLVAQVAGTPPQDVFFLTSATQQAVTWQGGAVDPPGCPAVVPTRNETWGSLKALYR